MLWTFQRRFPKYLLGNGVELTSKVPAAGSGPSCQAVRPGDHGVEHKATVLQDPAGERVPGRDLLADAVLEAELQSPELTTDCPHANLSAPIALTIVRYTGLIGDLFQIGHLALELDEHPPDQYQQRSLVV